MRALATPEEDALVARLRVAFAKILAGGPRPERVAIDRVTRRLRLPRLALTPHVLTRAGVGVRPDANGEPECFLAGVHERPIPRPPMTPEEVKRATQRLREIGVLPPTRRQQVDRLREIGVIRPTTAENRARWREVTEKKG